MIADAILGLMVGFIIVANIRFLGLLWRSHREMQQRYDAHMRRDKWMELQVQRKRGYR